MVTATQFKNAAKLAVSNINAHGDTDIFPFPFEHHAFFDNKNELIKLIVEYNDNFDESLTNFAPEHASSLTPVSYSGFRWATQMSPIWNAVFLSCVLAISEEAEKVRIPVKDETVFSYRYSPNDSGDLFLPDVGWRAFMNQSLKLADDYDYVVTCDISEFYPRLGHHRLENALKHIAGATVYPSRIMSFLSNFSNTRSFGLPIGGPAARILSEITINQIDQLMIGSGIKFTRFADDYHIFAKSREDAYRCLIFISEKLFDNQGLSLQKSKTRILTSAEFKSTSPLIAETDSIPENAGAAAAASHKDARRNLLRFSLRFDPYSATAEDDYEQLRSDIRKFDIIGLLKEELSKSRVHTALTRKIISAVKYLDKKVKDDAVLSILDNCDVLYPVFSSVLLMIEKVFDDLEEETKILVVDRICELIREDSHVMRVDVHLSYAVRVIANVKTTENQTLLQRIYLDRPSPMLRRDIILIMARWSEWYWLSDIKNKFNILSASERRAFLLASYTLRDEGSHFRNHIRKTLNPFEKFILKWAAEKTSNAHWVIPL